MTIMVVEVTKEGKNSAQVNLGEQSGIVGVMKQIQKYLLNYRSV